MFAVFCVVGYNTPLEEDGVDAVGVIVVDTAAFVAIDCVVDVGCVWVIVAAVIVLDVACIESMFRHLELKIPWSEEF